MYQSNIICKAVIRNWVNNIKERSLRCEDFYLVYEFKVCDCPLFAIPWFFTGNSVVMHSAFEMWWHTRRNQISSFAETDESI
jgi:hypothetical protein